MYCIELLRDWNCQIKSRRNVVSEREKEKKHDKMTSLQIATKPRHFATAASLWFSFEIAEHNELQSKMFNLQFSAISPKWDMIASFEFQASSSSSSDGQLDWAVGRKEKKMVINDVKFGVCKQKQNDYLYFHISLYFNVSACCCCCCVTFRRIRTSLFGYLSCDVSWVGMLQECHFGCIRVVYISGRLQTANCKPISHCDSPLAARISHLAISIMNGQARQPSCNGKQLQLQQQVSCFFSSP